MTAKPGKKIFACVRQTSAHGKHGTRDCEFIFAGKHVSAEECGNVVHRRRQKTRGSKFAGAAARLEKCQLVKPADFVAHAQGFIEVNEVGATAEKDMLAVVQYFSGAGMLVRRG